MVSTAGTGLLSQNRFTITSIFLLVVITLNNIYPEGFSTSNFMAAPTASSKTYGMLE
jgi:hypothetical protein